MLLKIMKKIILLLILSGIGVTALAKDTTKDGIDYCEFLTDIVIVAQNMRQENYSKSDILRKLEPAALNLATQELIDYQKMVNQKLVESAFTRPVSLTKEGKEFEVVNFSAGFRDGCMKSLVK